MKRILLLSFMLTCIVVYGAWAQRTVSGKITAAEDGSGIPGVNVVLKGTAVGTTSDVDGNYRLSVPEEGGTLVFSFIGLETQEIEIGARSVIDVAMNPDVQELTEVVVTALGIEREEKSLTYAVQDVDGDQFTQARDANIVNSLSGQVAGVQVTGSNGSPGSSSRIVIRGASTISGSNQPLFVVDGVPIDNENYGTAADGGGFDVPNGAADINPDDIESISVLKGPVAAALYGNRAANGVILITTKKGKGTKGLALSVNSTTTFDRPLRLPDFQNSYGQGASETYFEFVDGQHGYGDGVDESWGAPLDIGLEFVQWNDYETGAPSPWVAYPDNIKDFYETGVQMANNVAISGGDADKAFRLSVTNMDQKGMVPNTDLNKTTINASASIKLLKGLEASFSTNYVKQHSDNLTTVGYNSENPVQQMIWSGRNVNLPALADWENLPLAAPGTAAAGTPINWNTVFQNNPYWVQETNLNGFDKDRIFGNVQLNYRFTDWLSVVARTGIDSWSSLITKNSAKGSNTYPDGYYNQYARRFTELNHFFMFSFNRNFGDFGVSLGLGGNAMSQVYTRQYGEAPALELPGVYTLANLASGYTAVSTSLYEEERINSFISTGQFSFRDYVFVDLSARNDWWSVLPANNNSYLYPAASVSLVLTEMFDIYSNTLPYLKLRAGWSQVGSAGGLDPYSTQQVFQFRTDPWGSTPLVYNPETLNNPNIKPETTTGMEFGLSGKFFNGRVSLDATYYDQTSTDLIVSVEVSPASGYEFAYDNVAEIRNRGVELQLGTEIVKNEDFNLGLNFNFATYNNDVVKVNEIKGDVGAIVLGDGDGGQWNVDLQAREGYPYGVLFGPAYERDPDGNIIHEDGLPVIAAEYKVLGDIQPDWTGGVIVNASYKGLSLSALFDAKMGGDIYSMTNTWGRYAGVLAETLPGREVGIVGVGTKEVGDGSYVPNDVVVTAEAYNKAAYSNDIAESSVFDASYVKFRQLTLNYKLPARWFSSTPFKDVNIAFVGRNLALLYSKVPHIDPETAFSSLDYEQGVEFGQLPTARSLGFNINFKL